MVDCVNIQSLNYCIRMGIDVVSTTLAQPREYLQCSKQRSPSRMTDAFPTHAQRMCTVYQLHSPGSRRHFV